MRDAARREMWSGNSRGAVMQDAQAALTSCALLAESTQGVMDQAKARYPNVLA